MSYLTFSPPSPSFFHIPEKKDGSCEAALGLLCALLLQMLREHDLRINHKLVFGLSLCGPNTGMMSSF